MSAHPKRECFNEDLCNYELFLFTLVMISQAILFIKG